MALGFCLGFLFCLPLGQAGAGDQGQGTRARVTAGDCRKCHDEIVLTLERQGAAHGDLCLDCHQGHPPADMDIVPSCSRCHSGGEHFSLAGCLGCHTDPHTPLQIELTRKITGPCLTCHKEQIKELSDYPSIHSRFDCTACHNVHGQIQPCVNCHLGHGESMGRERCASCHQAHMPLEVTYGTDISSEECGSCHEDIYQTLARSRANHRQVACTACHEDRHGMIPRCQSCHGRPHPREIHAKFDLCADCHGTAHDLWASRASTSVFTMGHANEE